MLKYYVPIPLLFFLNLKSQQTTLDSTQVASLKITRDTVKTGALKSSDIDDVVISGTMKAVKRLETPVPVEIYTGAFLKKILRRFGDAGFYFLLNDSKGNYWAKFIGPFTHRLIIGESEENLLAKQTLNLWNIKVVKFNYKINCTQ